jgi:hypothetical protein
MALIVEDGTGLADAESYISVLDCDALLVKWGRSSDAWTALDEATKEGLLRNSTMYIDADYGMKFSGEVVNSTQALAWPRSNAYKTNGQSIPSDEVPVEVLRACSFIAVETIEGGVYFDDDNGARIASESVGLGQSALTESKSYQGGKDSSYNSKSADLVLKPLLSGSKGRTVYRA